MFFNKKKAKNTSKACNHKWKDFPWYLDSTLYIKRGYKRGEFTMRVIEPYVCIYCKERKDVELYKCNCFNFSPSDADEFINVYEKKYADKIKDEVVINDMISDMQLVDREYLELYDKITKPE